MAAGDGALRCRGLDPVAAARVDERHRHIELHGNAFGELGEQRAVALAAERGNVAIASPTQIHHGNLVEILRAVVRPQSKFHRRPPFAEIARQSAGAVDVAPAARRVRDRAIGPHRGGQIILKLAFARVAPADPDTLRGRRRIDVKAGAGGEPGQRIAVRVVNQMRAAVERHAKAFGVRDAAPANAV